MKITMKNVLVIFLLITVAIAATASPIMVIDVSLKLNADAKNRCIRVICQNHCQSEGYIRGICIKGRCNCLQ